MTSTNDNQAAHDTGVFPALMTEDELIRFLRILEVSKAKNHRHVIEHLKRMRGLPCIHIAKQPLYPQLAIGEWIRREWEKEMRR